MTTLFLTRARLKRDAPVAALARQLMPAEPGARTLAAHRLIWALFADGPDRARDFLWRQEAPGQFLALSSRPPAPLDDLFQLDTKDFAPALSVGDRLGFSLRANPVVSRAQATGQRGKRHDVVFDALLHVPLADRAGQRLAVVAEAGRAWLARQGTAHGFTVDGAAAVDGYLRERIPRDGAKPVVFGRIDIAGRLTVQDPALFLIALTAGFGRSRAYGCGLMLIRRA